jgi:recombination protein RecA
MPKEPAPSLTSIMQGMNRKYGANTIGSTKTMENLAIGRIKTGVSKLDEALGGGFPKGQLVEMYGQPSSGKSLISLLTVKQAQSEGLDCIYIDAENSYDPEWAKTVGVDTDKLYVTQMSVGEDVYDMIAKLLEANPGIIVLDSVAAMVTRSELEDPMDQQHMAPLARLMNVGIKKITALQQDTLIIFINQIRQNVSPYGAVFYTPGGKALLHKAAIRLEVKKDSQLITRSGKKTDPDVIGQIVDYKAMKNKTAAPYKFGSFRLLYDGAVIEE